MLGIISIPGSSCLDSESNRGRWWWEGEGQQVLETLRVAAHYLGEG